MLYVVLTAFEILYRYWILRTAPPFSLTMKKLHEISLIYTIVYWFNEWKKIGQIVCIGNVGIVADENWKPIAAVVYNILSIKHMHATTTTQKSINILW